MFTQLSLLIIDLTVKFYEYQIILKIVLQEITLLLIHLGDIFHSHSSNKIKIVTYEELKTLIKSISLFSDVLDISSSTMWEISKNEQLDLVHKEKRSKAISKYFSINNEIITQKCKQLYALLSKGQKRNVRALLPEVFIASDQQYLEIAKNDMACILFNKSLGTNPRI